MAGESRKNLKKKVKECIHLLLIFGLVLFGFSFVHEMTGESQVTWGKSWRESWENAPESSLNQILCGYQSTSLEWEWWWRWKRGRAQRNLKQLQSTATDSRKNLRESRGYEQLATAEWIITVVTGSHYEPGTFKENQFWRLACRKQEERKQSNSNNNNWRLEVPIHFRQCLQSKRNKRKVVFAHRFADEVVNADGIITISVRNPRPDRWHRSCGESPTITASLSLSLSVSSVRYCHCFFLLLLLLFLPLLLLLFLRILRRTGCDVLLDSILLPFAPLLPLLFDMLNYASCEFVSAFKMTVHTREVQALEAAENALKRRRRSPGIVPRVEMTNQISRFIEFRVTLLALVLFCIAFFDASTKIQWFFTRFFNHFLDLPLLHILRPSGRDVVSASQMIVDTWIVLCLKAA